jgi:hypothetical protein
MSNNGVPRENPWAAAAAAAAPARAAAARTNSNKPRTLRRNLQSAVSLGFGGVVGKGVQNLLGLKRSSQNLAEIVARAAALGAGTAFSEVEAARKDNTTEGKVEHLVNALHLITTSNLTKAGQTARGSLGAVAGVFAALLGATAGVGAVVVGGPLAVLGAGAQAAAAATLPEGTKKKLLDGLRSFTDSVGTAFTAAGTAAAAAGTAAAAALQDALTRVNTLIEQCQQPGACGGAKWAELSLAFGALLGAMAAWDPKVFMLSIPNDLRKVGIYFTRKVKGKTGFNINRARLGKKAAIYREALTNKFGEARRQAGLFGSRLSNTAKSYLTSAGREKARLLKLARNQSNLQKAQDAANTEAKAQRERNAANTAASAAAARRAADRAGRLAGLGPSGWNQAKTQLAANQTISSTPLAVERAQEGFAASGAAGPPLSQTPSLSNAERAAGNAAAAALRPATAPAGMLRPVTPPPPYIAPMDGGRRTRRNRRNRRNNF